MEVKRLCTNAFEVPAVHHALHTTSQQLTVGFIQQQVTTADHYLANQLQFTSRRCVWPGINNITFATRPSVILSNIIVNELKKKHQHNAKL